MLQRGRTFCSKGLFYCVLNVEFGMADRPDQQGAALAWALKGCVRFNCVYVNEFCPHDVFTTRAVLLILD
jgi:hypothetical protein